ncbi:hypothetical protein [Bacteroides nordii]|uniref:hypothetical protein n=1 Tax=Bacteroides nordii TaxID=291645 RepID=UPI0011C22E5B|nr:hypothetical protein [Bacteroides nordii]
MSLPSVFFSGINKALPHRGTYDASVCNVVLDVHVKQHDMYMWDSTTCTCGAVKHVHVKQGCSPGKGTFLSEKNKVQHRATVMMSFRGTSATEKIYP